MESDTLVNIFSKLKRLTRSRPLLAALRLTTLCLTTLCFTTTAYAEQESRILVLGDSLSAAYGMQVEEGWVNLLRTKLKDSYVVINASISGETSDGGLRALPRLLETHHPDIVIIELGGNDGLRGFPLQTIERNIQLIIQKTKTYTDKILLLGVRIPPNYGPSYTEAFHQIFQRVAATQNISSVPFIMKGIATKDDLMQADQLHPNAAAQNLILALVWQELEKLTQASSLSSNIVSHDVQTNIVFH